jgi:hypothetical protein
MIRTKEQPLGLATETKAANADAPDEGRMLRICYLCRSWLHSPDRMFLELPLGMLLTATQVYPTKQQQK